MQGYCRVAKILQDLLKRSQSPAPPSERSLAIILKNANLAFRRLPYLLSSVVRRGLYNTERYRHRPNDSYHVGTPSEAHYRTDMLTYHV